MSATPKNFLVDPMTDAEIESDYAEFCRKWDGRKEQEAELEEQYRSNLQDYNAWRRS